MSALLERVLDEIRILTSKTNSNDTDNYWIVNEDKAANPQYFGHINKYGNWYILRVDTSAGTYRYIAGSTPTTFDTAWTNRASLTYVYPNLVDFR